MSITVFFLVTVILLGVGIYLYRLHQEVLVNKNDTTLLLAKIDKLQQTHYQIIYQSSMIFFECSAEWVIHSPSQKLIDLLGIPYRSDLPLLQFATDDHKVHFHDLSKHIIETKESVQRDLAILNSSGVELWLEVNASWIDDRIYCSLLDISPRIRHRELLERIHNGLDQTQLIFVTDLNGYITYCNRAFAEKLSYQIEELIGKKIENFVGSINGHSNYQEILKIALRGQSWTGEICLRGKKGNQFWIQSSAMPSFNDGGLPQRLMHLNQDITYQKNLINQLNLKRHEAEVSSARLQSLIDSSADGILVINSRSIILEYNPSCEVIFGYSRSEAIGKSVAELLIPTRYRKKHLEGLEQLLKTPEKSILGTVVEVHGTKKSGGEFPLELSIFNYTSNGQSFFGAFVRDKTAAKIADISLKASMRKLELENKLWSMIEGVQLTLLQSVNSDDILSALVRVVGSGIGYDVVQFYQKVGPSESEIMELKIGWSNEPHKHEEFMTVSKNMVFSKNQGVIGTVWREQTIQWHFDLKNNPEFLRNKKVHNLLLNTCVGIPVYVFGEIYGVLEVYSEELLFEDPVINRALTIASSFFSKALERQLNSIQERELQEKMASHSKMSLLGELSSGVAHEINNPLMALSGQATKALYYIEEPHVNLTEAQSSITKVLNHVKRISKIVRGLRQFSRNEDHDPFSLSNVPDIVEDAIEICRPMITKNQIELLLDLAPAEIECRPGQLVQVLVNLIQNACDAIAALESRWIKVSVTANERDVAINVRDSGGGIPEAIKNDLFAPFFTTKPVGKGTGLGLSISKGLIESHGGQLTLETNCPHTNFKITLPRAQSQEKAS